MKKATSPFRTWIYGGVIEVADKATVFFPFQSHFAEFDHTFRTNANIREL